MKHICKGCQKQCLSAAGLTNHKKRCVSVKKQEAHEWERLQDHLGEEKTLQRLKRQRQMETDSSQLDVGDNDVLGLPDTELELEVETSIMDVGEVCNKYKSIYYILIYFECVF